MVSYNYEYELALSIVRMSCWLVLVIFDDCHLANPEVWVCPLPSTGNGNGDTTHTSRLTDVMNVFFSSCGPHMYDTTITNQKTPLYVCNGGHTEKVIWVIILGNSDNGSPMTSCSDDASCILLLLTQFSQEYTTNLLGMQVKNELDSHEILLLSLVTSEFILWVQGV